MKLTVPAGGVSVMVMIFDQDDFDKRVNKNNKSSEMPLVLPKKKNVILFICVPYVLH